MFSQSKTSTPRGFSLGLPLGGPNAAAGKPGKPLTPAEQYQQALVKAGVFIEDSRARLQRELDKYGDVANNSYWTYGYFGANMCVTMAACLTLGNRVPFFRSYSGWISLAGGYFGGQACKAVHCQYLLANVVKQVDKEIGEAQRLDEETNSIVPDYKREMERLTNVKYELMPTLPEAIAARQNHQADQSIDDRVDALLDAYTKRKEALKR